MLAGPSTFAVADGMGGHAGGEVASAIVISVLAEVEGPIEDPEETIATLIRANEAIRDRGRTDDALTGMGATVAGVSLNADGTVTVFNVGDARVYRSRGDVLVQLSFDHSLVGELVRTGELTESEALRHPQRNVVTRALGIAEAVEPHVAVDETAPGDRYLVCSDGLFNEVDPIEMATLLQSDDRAERRAQALLEAALERGGRDNVSVVVLDVGTGRTSDGLDADTNPSVTPAEVPLTPVWTASLITEVPGLDPASEPPPSELDAAALELGS